MKKRILLVTSVLALALACAAYGDSQKKSGESGKTEATVDSESNDETSLTEDETEKDTEAKKEEDDEETKLDFILRSDETRGEGSYDGTYYSDIPEAQQFIEDNDYGFEDALIAVAAYHLNEELAYFRGLEVPDYYGKAGVYSMLHNDYKFNQDPDPIIKTTEYSENGEEYYYLKMVGYTRADENKLGNTDGCEYLVRLKVHEDGLITYEGDSVALTQVLYSLNVRAKCYTEFSDNSDNLVGYSIATPIPEELWYLAGETLTQGKDFNSNYEALLQATYPLMPDLYQHVIYCSYLDEGAEPAPFTEEEINLYNERVVEDFHEDIPMEEYIAQQGFTGNITTKLYKCYVKDYVSYAAASTILQNWPRTQISTDMRDVISVSTFVEDFTCSDVYEQ